MKDKLEHRMNIKEYIKEQKRRILRIRSGLKRFI